MKLFDHQKAALERIKNTECNLALYHQCGCGKTITAIETIKWWKSLGQSPALVIAPLSILESAWMADVEKVGGLVAVNLYSKNKKRRLAQLDQPADLYVINYEQFKILFHELAKKNFKVLVIDESSKLKSYNTQITRAVLSVSGMPTGGVGKKYHGFPEIPHRYVLSGTPAAAELEYYSQISVVQPNAFGPSFYAFRATYFREIKLGNTGQSLWEFRPEMRDIFLSNMQPVCDIVRKEDALDLPEQTRVVRRVKLNEVERRMYKEMKDDLVLRFGDKMVLATNALVEIMKLRQITSGFLYGEDNDFYALGDSKANELLLLLNEIGNEQVIIWTNFRRGEARHIAGRLPSKSYTVLDGGTKDRQKSIDDFQGGYKQYLIANPQSAGHGLTFTNCCYAAYYGLSYSHELMVQSEERIHRIGQGRPCTYYYLLAEDSIDEVIYATLNDKADVAAATLAHLKGTG